MEKTSLPFSPTKQQALMGHAIIKKDLYLDLLDRIDPSWFSNIASGELFGIYKGWSERYDKNKSKLPTKSEIQDCFISKDARTKERLIKEMASWEIQAGAYDLEAILTELTEWLKCKIYMDSVENSTELFEKQNYKEAFTELNEAIKKYESVNFFPEDGVSFKDWKKNFKEVSLEREDALTIGLDTFDKIIDPLCTSGSLLKGDTTVILAPSNVGKTTFLITTAIANVVRGKKVLFISHEGRQGDLANKMYSCFFQKTLAELDLIEKLGKPDTKMDAGAAYLDQHMTYIAWNDPAKMTVEEVGALIETKQRQEIAKTGRGFDMVVNDYPAKLRSVRTNKVSMEFRIEQSYVYNYFVNLALKHKFHSLLAQQTNREASKINSYAGKHGTAKRLIGKEDSSETYGPVQTATNLISLNRNEDYGDKIILHHAKSRSSEFGFSVIAKSDFSKSITHSNTLGCVWYKGSSIGKVSDDIIKQYLDNPDKKNKAIPQRDLQLWLAGDEN